MKIKTTAWAVKFLKDDGMIRPEHLFGSRERARIFRRYFSDKSRVVRVKITIEEV